MIQPARLALGILVAATGALACADADRLSGPDESSALRARHALTSVPSAEPGPMTTRLSPDYCADVSGRAPQSGAPLVLAACAPSSASQQYSWQPTGEVKVFGSMCLAATYGRGQNSDAALVVTCNGSAQQKWRYSDAGELRDAANHCLSVRGNRAAKATRLVMRECDGSTAQKWNVRMTTVGDSTVDSTATSTPTPVGDSVPADTAVSAPVVVTPVPVSGTAGAAALPRATADLTAPAPTGASIRVAAGQDLQAALDAAKPGDEVVLDAGATFVGNFVIRAKAGSGWITVRSSGSLPGSGTRVTPATAAAFAKIRTPNISPAIATEPGAHHVRLAGLDVGAVSSVPKVYSLVALGDGSPAQNTLSEVPHHLLLDRVYVHGSSSLDVRRCVALNSAWTAIVDSYLSDCHSNDGDSQAIWGSNGPGPFTIQNNTLEGAAENIMFGGDDSRSTDLVPADITIRNNHVVKPMAWKGVWLAKNLIELKVGKRVLIDGNVIENSWVSGQIGFAVVLWSVNQGGGAPWSETSDVTVQNNVIRHAANAFQLSPAQYGMPAVPLARVTIRNNVITGIGTDAAMGAAGGRMFQVDGAIADLTLSHNTTESAGHWLYFVSQPITALPRLTVADNVGYFVGGVAVRSDYGAGTTAWTAFAGGTGGVMSGNVVAGAAGGLPDGNSAPAGTSADASGAIGISAGSGNYRLSASSPFKGKATDGTDPGVNQDALDGRIRGVALP